MVKKGSAKKGAAPKGVVITRITHYPEDDPECTGDYYDIVLIRDGKVIAEFGDYYHDKGQEKSEGFIRGVEYALGVKVEVVDEQVADR